MASRNSLRHSIFDAALEIGLVDPNLNKWINEGIIEEEPEDTSSLQVGIQLFKSLTFG